MTGAATTTTTFVIPLSRQDLAVISDLEQFRQGVQMRLGYDAAVIIVNSDGVPVAPVMDAREIPSTAIWLPEMGF